MLAANNVRDVRPVDQMRSIYCRQQGGHAIIEQAHSLFQQRTAFHNFNPPVFNRLTDLLEEALVEYPHNAQVKYELAWTLVQNCADLSALERAHQLITEALATTSNYRLSMYDHLPESLISKAQRLNQLLEKTTSDDWLSAEPRVPQRLNWAVHNRCPMVCMGCYNCFSPETLTIEEAKIGLYKLAMAGVESLIISGGDPILWPDLLAFLAFAWENGLSLGVDTTGYTFTEDLFRKVGTFVHYIGLPLDGSTREIQNGFRRGPKDILDHTIRNLETCDKLGINVKINTTVNQYNIDDLIEIGDIVDRHSCVGNWSVFQWSPLRSTQKLREEFAVPTRTFEAKVAELYSRFPNVNIRTRSAEDRELTHFFVQCDGQVVTFGSEVNEEYILGNILTDEIESMIRRPMFNKRSSKHVPTERFMDHASNATDSYPYQTVGAGTQFMYAMGV